MPFQSRRLTYPSFVSALLLLLGFASPAISAATKLPIAEVVTVSNAWVRPTSPGQEVGAAYMTLTSKQDAKLVGVESDASKSVEIHSMTMNNGVMKMRMLDTLELSAGKPYALAPGGYHLMLFDLKEPLAEGKVVNFTLHFKTKSNAEFTQNVAAKVQAPADTDTEAHHH